MDKSELFHRENIIDILSPTWYHKKTRLFSFYMSEAKCEISQELYLRNPKTGKKMKFEMNNIDKDSSGEDIYGWRFISVFGGFNLLIIND